MRYPLPPPRLVQLLPYLLYHPSGQLLPCYLLGLLRQWHRLNLCLPLVLSLLWLLLDL